MTDMQPKEFLSLIWPKRLIRYETLELRAINREDKKRQRKFLTSVDEFLQQARTYGSGWDIYFGVSTRFQSSGGTKGDCFRTNCVWVDIDKPKLPDFGGIKPDVVVNSGGGYHVYWVLENPVLVHDGKFKEIEAVNRALVKRFGGDIASIDVSRILRVPSFYNYKYTPPKKIHVQTI